LKHRAQEKALSLIPINQELIARCIPIPLTRQLIEIDLILLRGIQLALLLCASSMSAAPFNEVADRWRWSGVTRARNAQSLSQLK
jgi:hypothetical protein